MNNAFKVRKGLLVEGSGSVIVDIQGATGQLLSITDSPTGSTLKLPTTPTGSTETNVLVVDGVGNINQRDFSTLNNQIGNWGTARNVTIGGTTRSVDGSTTYTWTLSDIGVNNNTLTLATSGIATGSDAWTANQGSNSTFTVNVPGTNLSEGTRTSTTVPLNSSTGTNATLSAVSTTLAGAMIASDKSKLDGIESGAQVNVATNLGTSIVSTNSRAITSSTGTNITVPTATTTVAGFMAHTDKTKLNGIATSADNYSSWNLRTEGVQRTTIGSAGILDIVGGTNVTTSYGAGGVVTINSSFTNTTYSAGTGITLTGTTFSLTDEQFTTTLKNKLDGIEAGAQVNVGDVFDNSGTYLNLRAQATTKTDVGLGNVTDHTQVRKLSSSTSGYVPTWNGITGDQLNDGYGVETSLSGASTHLVRADAVKAYVDSLLASNDAMIYKGSLGTGGTYTSLPTTHNIGWTVKVITAGTYAGKVAEIGDMYISVVSRSGTGNVDSDWHVFQANIDGAVIGPSSVVNEHVALFDGTSGKLIKSAGVVLGNGTLTLATSGIATGDQTFSSNQTSNSTFTVSVPATNIGVTGTGDTRTITSSTGTNVTIPVATNTLAGWLSTSDKTKLDGIEAGADVNVGTNLGTAVVSTNSRSITSSTGNNVTVPVVTTTVAGFMSHTDKSKLDGIEAGADVNVATNLGSSGTGGTRTITSSTGTNTSITYTTTDIGAEPSFSKNTGFNKNFGTTSGTVTQGNDSRLSDSREWTADTVTQVEAETGTATTRRAWTALRVFQSVASWWNGSSAKTKLDGIEAGADVNVGTDLSWTNGTTSGPQINSSTGTNAIIPTASGTISGVVTTGSQTWAGTKTFSSAVVLSTAGTTTSHAVRADRSISASGIATGGGNLTTDRTISVPGTNIAEGTRTTTTVPITSSTGTNATLSAVSTTLAGVMTSSDKTKLDGIATSADNYSSWNLKTEGTQRTTVTSGGTLDIVGGTNVTTSYGAGGIVTINSSFTNTTYSAGNGISLSGTTFSVAGGDGLTQEASGLAVDSSVVRTTGAQTISGLKTFNDNLAVNGTISGSVYYGDGSQLTGVASFSAPITVQIDDTDSPYTITNQTIVIVNSISGSVSVNLPDLTTIVGTEDQRSILIYKNDYSANTVFVETSGSQFINGKDRDVIVGVQQAVTYNPTTDGWVQEGNLYDETDTYVSKTGDTITGNLTVNGTLTADEIVETSTILVKENINPIFDALNTITKLSGVTYTRKDTKINEAGLIAESVNEILPDLVTKNEDGSVVGLKYTKLIAYLIESIKTLNDEITELKNK